jgi:hypothetical protein
VSAPLYLSVSSGSPHASSSFVLHILSSLKYTMNA